VTTTVYFRIKIFILGYRLDKGIKSRTLTNWKVCADLAIAWNSCAIARKSIFNNANYDYWRVSW